MRLEELVHEGEVLIQYHLVHEYVNRNAIGIPGCTDLAAELEDTLHRVLESGGTDFDLYAIMGARKLSVTERQMLGGDECVTSIDLDYYLPSYIDSWKEVSV